MSRAEIALTFASWLDEYRVLNPDAKLPSVATYTDTFMRHMPERCKPS